jgi:hypothetical protein
MLFELTYIEDDINKINDVTSFFFSSTLELGVFSDLLVPDWFRPVFNGSPVLRNKFSLVFDLYHPLALDVKEAILQGIENDTDISTLCSDLSQKPIFTSVQYKFAHEAIKDLFDHLYSDTLQKSALLNQAIGSSINSHFIKWKESNAFSVCPFCGLENYTSVEGTNRDPYDHWLCKSKYPLSAVNFKNLIPIGDKCNQTSVKGEKDILHTDAEATIRRISFYPYFKHSGVKISLSCIIPPTAGYKGEWDVIIVSNDPIDQNKVETWVEVFNLKIRYLSWIKLYLDLWKDEFALYLEKNEIVLTATIEYVKEVIKNWKKSLFSMKIFPGVLLLEAYIEYLLNDADQSFVFAFGNVRLYSVK